MEARTKNASHDEVSMPAPIFFTEEEKEAMKKTPGAYVSPIPAMKEKEIENYLETISRLKKVVEAREKELHTCANELCYQCGQYKQEHLGACSDCRWLPIRKGRYE